MFTRAISSTIAAGWISLVLVGLMATTIALPIQAQQQDVAVTAPAPSNAGGSAEAAQHYRRGVELYEGNQFLEALNEFNRALTLDPKMQNAIEYRDKCNAKRQIGAAGKDPAGVQTFDTIDPSTMPTASGTPNLTADEMKLKNVAELLQKADLYLDNQKYEKAEKLYGEVLIIAPENSHAKEGLHKAVIGASENRVNAADNQIDEDRQFIREYTRKSKILPAGADPTGIKPVRISVPPVEESYVEPKKKSDIEKVLDSEVSLDFGDPEHPIHITELAKVIRDFYDVNIVIDDRVVMPPPRKTAATAAMAGATGMTTMGPGMQAMPNMGAMPMGGSPMGGGNMNPYMQGNMNMQRNRSSSDDEDSGNYSGNMYNQNQMNMNGRLSNNGSTQYGEGYVTDGMVYYLDVRNVPMRSALRAALRPLNLDYSIQSGFVWISTPQRLRKESFEELITKTYQLRNAGSETLPKIVLQNPGGTGGNSYGGSSGSGYGSSGSSYGNSGSSGSYSGGRSSGTSIGGSSVSSGSGYSSGSSGSYGSSGSSGSYGSSGGYGSSGSSGGYGNSGNTGGIQISNISQLFGTISDSLVGEAPPLPLVTGVYRGGTGNTGIGRSGSSSSEDGGTGSGGLGNYSGSRGGGGGGSGSDGVSLGSASGSSLPYDMPPLLSLMTVLIDDVVDPYTGELISWWQFLAHTSQLIVHNTPSNLEKFEAMLPEFDVMPKQVSIEAKFVTISTENRDKIGFNWDVSYNPGNGIRRIADLDADQGSDETYSYDVNGDGVSESIPFYTTPNGKQIFPSLLKTITSTTTPATTNISSTDHSFQLSGILMNNEDGDKVSVALDYLSRVGETELLSAPRVTTMNRKPAVVASLETDYYASYVETNMVSTGSNLTSGGNLGVTQTVTPQPFNFGITLSVTPQISGNDQVRLWLNPQVTDLTGVATFDSTYQLSDSEPVTSTIRLPKTKTQAVWTNVIVHDGDTVVLGGLVSDQTRKSTEKTPYLADIPVLGTFFKGKAKEVTQSSLLIFVTPTVIDTTGARFFGSSAAQETRSTEKELGAGDSEESASAEGAAKSGSKKEGLVLRKEAEKKESEPKSGATPGS